MKISKIESYPYELKFKDSFKTAKSNYEHRNGYIIKIFIDDLIGLGEVAPLSGFHDESLLECSYALEAINQSISNIKDITSDELFDIFTLHSEDKPSLLFGLQTALLDILSQKSEVPLNKYLNNDCLDIINLNAVHTIHAPDKNFNIVKVKLGYNNIHDDNKGGGVERYKGVLMLNPGTWQAQTDYQKMMGLQPDPCRAIAVNLQTLDTQVLDFNF